MNMISRVAFIAIMSLALPTRVLAAPLTYEQAIERALATAPGATAVRANIAAARADAQAAGRLPDPRLEVGLDNFPTSGPPAFSFNGDNMTMVRVGVEQDVPNLAKRRAARAQAGAVVATAEAFQATRMREIRLGAGLAWVELFYADRRFDRINAILTTLRSLPASSRSAVTSGSSRPAQAIDADQALANLEDRRDELTAAIGRARAMLARWTGISDSETVGNPPNPDLDPEKLRAVLPSRPEIISADANVRRAQADIDVARADRRPDWGVNAAYQRRDPRYGDMVSAGVTISLPFFARTRQNARIAGRLSAASEAEAEREDARRAVEADLAAALADHRMHHEQAARARDVLLPLASNRADLETASYAADRASLADVLATRTALASAELTALDREAEVARDAVRLSLTFGGDDQ